MSLARIRRRAPGVPPLRTMQHPITASVKGRPRPEVDADEVRTWLSTRPLLGFDPAHPERPPALTALLDRLVIETLPPADPVPGLAEAVAALLAAGADPALPARVETATGPSSEAYPPAAHAAVLADLPALSLIIAGGGLVLPGNCASVLESLADHAQARGRLPPGASSFDARWGIHAKDALLMVLDHAPPHEMLPEQARQVVLFATTQAAYAIPPPTAADCVASIIENMPHSPFAGCGKDAALASLVADVLPSDTRSPAAQAMAAWIVALASRAAADPATAMQWWEGRRASGAAMTMLDATVEVAARTAPLVARLDPETRPRRRRQA